ncbi:MAG: hypothetical protein ACK5MR_18855, partial [Cumulibacter sp.]
MPRIRDALIRDFRDAYRDAKGREAEFGEGPWSAGTGLVWAADALNIAEMIWVTSDMARMATDASQ